jgi:peptide/nickel transport system substrate-binding protein
MFASLFPEKVGKAIGWLGPEAANNMQGVKSMTTRTVSRRSSLKVLGSVLGGALGASLASGKGIRFAYAESKTVLVIGVDISDTNSLDPGRQFVYSAPTTMRAAYETLVTMDPGDYETVRPLLAEKWERADDGAALVFHLRDGVKFVSGNPLTAEDVKFTFDRLVNLKDNPAELASNIDHIDVVDRLQVKLVMKEKTEPLLNLLVGPSFVISDSKTVQANGGLSTPEAEKGDKATAWLDSASAGTGPYVLKQWERNSQIVLERNDGYWREPGGFKRIIIKHIAESATQLLTIQRGDIDAALNLTSEQLDGLKGQSGVDIVEGKSLDYVYMTLTSGADLNPALAKKEARQAVAAAIDYDGIIKGLMGGYATRPPTFIPVGVGGVTEALTKEIGYHYDPDHAKSLLEKAGLASGFSFDLYYGDASVAGTSYLLIAQKIQSDLSKVGITVKLNPLDQTTARTKYRAGELPSFLTFWNPDGPEPWTWASASVQRVAKRVRWTVPAEMTELVAKAGAASTQDEANKWYRKYMDILVDNANYLIIFQPTYRVATRTSIKGWRLTAAGWQVDLYDVKPA